jgi:hypothetical protein
MQGSKQGTKGRGKTAMDLRDDTVGSVLMPTITTWGCITILYRRFSAAC